MVYPKGVYALYKGDDLIAEGTKAEIAEQLGVKIDTVRYYGTPTYKKRTSDEKGRRLVYLGKEEDFE